MHSCILKNAGFSIIAIVLLGFCWLIVLDMTANFIVIYSLAGNGFFLLVSGLILIFTALAMFWAAIKIRPECIGTHDSMKNGAIVGMVSSVLICAIMLTMAFFDSGVERIMPPGDFDLSLRFGTYALLCIIIILAYAILGAIMGAVSCGFSLMLEKIKAEKSKNEKSAPKKKAIDGKPPAALKKDPE